MKPGITPESARADLAIPLDDLTKRYHAARGREDVSVVPLQRELLGDTRPALWALLAGVLVLLAVACANVGGLLLVRRCGARARSRRAPRAGRDAAARRRRSTGGIDGAARVQQRAGAGAGRGLIRAVRAAAPGNIPGIADVSIDWRVLAFAVIVTGASIALCVIAPMLQSLSRDVLSLLQQGGRSLAGEGGRARRVLAGIGDRPGRPAPGGGDARHADVPQPARGRRRLQRRSRAGVRRPATDEPISGRARQSGLRRSSAAAAGDAARSAARRIGAAAGRSGAWSAWTGRSPSKGSRRPTPRRIH